MPVDELRLGTRGSQLARWQAEAVATRLRECGGPPCRIVVIRTSGDRLQEAPLSEVGGKRLFVREIEDALLTGDIDIAVHSSKDMPAILPDGLTIGAVLPREDPLDAIVLPTDVVSGFKRNDVRTNVVSGFSRTERPAFEMPFGDLMSALGPAPTIGTSSVRRAAQLIRVMPKARFVPIRGNLDTRLRKLDERQYDAIVLAAAGLRRLGMASRISATLPASASVPAPGQGIVAVEIRDGDAGVIDLLRTIEDREARAALEAERAVVRALGGGCQTPIGALASPVAADDLEIVAIVVSLDGQRAVQASGRGRMQDAAATGARVGEQLLALGAGSILAEALRAQGAVEGIQP
jgi:hydroxymethylbilane synthase